MGERQANDLADEDSDISMLQVQVETSVWWGARVELGCWTCAGRSWSEALVVRNAASQQPVMVRDLPGPGAEVTNARTRRPHCCTHREEV